MWRGYRPRRMMRHAMRWGFGGGPYFGGWGWRGPGMWGYRRRSSCCCLPFFLLALLPFVALAAFAAMALHIL